MRIYVKTAIPQSTYAHDKAHSTTTGVEGDTTSYFCKLQLKVTFFEIYIHPFLQIDGRNKCTFALGPHHSATN